jgi:hypothetical protein
MAHFYIAVCIHLWFAITEPPVELTTQAAWCFIVAASLVLVVLFFFINYLIYVVIVMFCLLGAQCTLRSFVLSWCFRDIIQAGNI